MLKIAIDGTSGKPLFQQIKDQLISLIEGGILKAGNRLPTSRELSSQLGLNRSTVYKAYRELWSLGYIDSRPGSYSTVRERPAIRRKNSIAPSTPSWLEALPLVKDSFSMHFRKEELLYDFRTFSPDPDIIPIEDFRKCYNDVIKGKGSRLMGYGHPGGYEPLLRYISELMSSHKIEAKEEELIITSGAQNALDMLCRLFRKENWKVVVEDPGYSEAVELFRSYGATVLPCPITDKGPDTDRLQELLDRESPSFFFTIPNFQNPTGFTSTQERREKILELCEEYGVPLIEDGYSQDMRGTLLSIKSMDRNNMVIYIGTFSKILFPGVRTGWIFSDRHLIDRLKNLQYITQVSGNISIQAALERFCRLGYYDLHLKRAHSLYRKRMERVLASLDRNFSKDWGTYSRPQGGYYLWIELGSHFPEEKTVIQELRDRGIAVRPGSFSKVTQTSSTCFRLSIAHMSEGEIDEGIKLMCHGLNEIKGDK